jgi:hypothetical protein
VGAIVWVAPPAVLPTPARTGEEGPPRPLGREPPIGPPLKAGPAIVAAQNDAMLHGPFPTGPLTRGVSEGTLLLDPREATRELAFSRIREAGASAVRIPVDWRDIAPAAPTAQFRARDAGDPSYHFGALDAAVRDAVAAGLRPLLVVAHAPAFAEARPRWPYAFPGSWDPSPQALEEFAAALASRYDGSFSDPQEPGRMLPRVGLFQAWNEPNLARYLEPQWVVGDGRWSGFSPLMYRQLLNGFYRGVKSVQPGAVVAAAGVAPNGERAGMGRMAPISFLNALLCLGAGGRTRAGGCPEAPHFDALAFHPLSVGDPDDAAGRALDVSIADAAKVVRLLHAAERLGTALPAGRKALWVTELNWESSPPAAAGAPEALQARWLSRSLHRLWIAGVSLVAWQFLVDPYPQLKLATATGGIRELQRPAGLYSAGPGGDLSAARPKAFLEGFRLPFDPLRASRRTVRVWALPPDAQAPARLERLIDGRWHTIATLRPDAAGVLNALVALRGTALLRLQSGSLTSAPAPIQTLAH